jgi:hypothetical protein
MVSFSYLEEVVLINLESLRSLSFSKVTLAKSALHAVRSPLPPEVSFLFSDCKLRSLAFKSSNLSVRSVLSLFFCV